MKQIPGLAALILLAPSFPASVHGMRSNPDAFFAPATMAPEDLSPDIVYPNGKLFPFSFFSVGGGTEEKADDLFPEEEVQKEFANYKTFGIPLFGPQYELNERSLKDAEEHSLKIVYTVGADINFHGDSPAEVNPEAVFEEVSAQVKAVMDNPAVAFWYLEPEELRPWRKNEMEYLKAASRAVRETDTEKRPLWIYDPAHAGAGRLASIAPWVDYLGKGMYPNYASMKDSRIWCRWTIEQQIEAIRESGADSIPIAVPEMFQEPEQEELEVIPNWVRHDVYLSLVTGAKGVIVFSARRRPNFEARQIYLDAYVKVAQELLGAPNLGQVFLFGERRDHLKVDVISGPGEVEMLFPSGGVEEALTYPSVSHLDVAYGDERYLFLVNSAHEPVQVAVGGMPFGAVEAHSLFDEDLRFDIGEGEFQTRLAPLEVKAYRLTRR